jgi:anti-sigma factor RsiW
VFKEDEQTAVTCPVVIDKLSAFIDGELPDADRLAVQGHLDRCAACAAVHRRLSDAWALAGEVPHVLPRVDLWPRIEVRLPAGPRRGWLAGLGWDPFPVLATLAVAVGLTIGLSLGGALVHDTRPADADPRGPDGPVDVEFFADVFSGSLAEVVLPAPAARGGVVR